jgi:Histidine kinase-, DNA gyrase B-, and HSP90-like ATPase
MKVLSLNILDIIQNSLRAGAGLIGISINESAAKDIYLIEITDNGSGIPEDILRNVTDPFVTTRTTRNIGLGLPLLKQHAELAGGDLEIFSEKGKGTKVRAWFSYRNVDRQPLGDIVGVLIIAIAANPGIDFTYTHTTDKGEYKFSTAETREYLGISTLQDRYLLDDLASMIAANLMEIEVDGVIYKVKEF